MHSIATGKRRFGCVYLPMMGKGVRDGSTGSLGLFLQALRQALTGRYEAVLGESYAPVLASLLFGGHYDELPPGLLESFSTTGLIHILSVSGSMWHCCWLSSSSWAAPGIAPRGLCLVSVSFLFLYGALSDFSSPVVRASLWVPLVP